MTYQFTQVREPLVDELRMNKIGNKVIRISDQKLMVEFSIFSYEKFDRSRTLLDMPSTVTCHVDKPGRALNVLPIFIKEINSSFKQ